MQHIEIHVIESDRDIDSAVECGLLDGPFAIRPCEHCDAELGALGTFHPFVIVLNGDDEWTLCYECSFPLFEPTPLTDADDDDLDEDEPDDGFLLY